MILSVLLNVLKFLCCVLHHSVSCFTRFLLFLVVSLFVNSPISFKRPAVSDQTERCPQGCSGAGTRRDGVPHFFSTGGGRVPHYPHFFGLKFVQKLVHCCNRYSLKRSRINIDLLQSKDTQTRVAVSQDKTKDPLWRFF